MRVHLDFETRSAVDIYQVGAWLYAMHPSTEILCLAFAVDDEPVELIRYSTNTHPVGSPEQKAEHESFKKLAKLADNPDVLFCAYNAFFEQVIWNRQFGKWKPIPLERWRCVQAKASAYGLPAKLEKAAIAARLLLSKDMGGSGMMKKLSKPRNPRKGEDPNQIYWFDDPADYDVLYKYCKTDVEVERQLDHTVPDLSPEEQKLWFIDQKINHRGMRIDKPFAVRVDQMLQYHNHILNSELQQLTGGYISAGTEVSTMLNYLKSRGIPIENLQKGTVAKLIASGQLGEHEVEVLRYRQELGKSSNAKYTKMKDSSDDDGIIRDCYGFSRANTGRWGGRGVQPQNLPADREGKVDVPSALIALSQYDYQTLRLLYGRKINEVASACLRGSFIPRDNNHYLVADYSAIEARVVMWVANDMVGLKQFSESDQGLSEDIYVQMARRIYNNPNLTKKDKPERQLGKQAILGCGFGMGAEKFRETCATYKIYITPEKAEEVVKLYRSIYGRVQSFWYELDNTFKWCIQNPNQSQGLGYLNLYYDRQRDVLFLRLPSGRFLSYHEPRIVRGRFNNASISFMMEVKHQWVRKESYGGHLTENVVQATARDLMASAMPKLEEENFPITMHTHDELVCERSIGDENLQRMLTIICDKPQWGAGIPLVAEGSIEKRYMK